MARPVIFFIDFHLELILISWMFILNCQSVWRLSMCTEIMRDVFFKRFFFFKPQLESHCWGPMSPALFSLANPHSVLIQFRNLIGGQNLISALASPSSGHSGQTSNWILGSLEMWQTDAFEQNGTTSRGEVQESRINPSLEDSVGLLFERWRWWIQVAPTAKEVPDAEFSISGCWPDPCTVKHFH